MNDGSVSVALWESAPACVAVQEHPMRTFDEARRKCEDWRAQIEVIDALLRRDDVSASDKMALCLEKMTARCCLTACVNVMQACEVQMREQAKRIEEKWGWLL